MSANRSNKETRVGKSFDDDMELAREKSRPAAPMPDGTKASRPAVDIGLALAAVVAGVGFAAWKLRDRPEDLARLQAPAAEQAAGTTGGKIAERAGSNPSGASPSGADQSPIPVAHRAALIVAAPEEKNGVKVYPGAIVWRLEAANRGPGQQLSSVVRADIDIAEAKLKASITFEKNSSTTFPASYIINIRFDPAPNSPIGAVKQITMPQLRRDKSSPDEALAGLPAVIDNNIFLIGLSASSDQHNIDMLKNRNWLSIPMKLDNEKMAKIAFEKGPTGERVFNEALIDWQGQTPQ